MKEFNKDNVTAKERLDENYGASFFLDTSAQQTHKSFEVWFNFLRDIKPKRILEIGTGEGGFAFFLQTTINDLEIDTHLLTFDIRHGIQERLINIGVDARIENIFNSDYTKVSEEIINYIQQDGITVVLCDGASKILEFTLLSEYLKSGDFIFAHDYSPTYDYFKEYVDQKIWNWFEIEDSSIEEVVNKHNLLSYESEMFRDIVWVGKIKK